MASFFQLNPKQLVSIVFVLGFIMLLQYLDPLQPESQTLQENDIVEVSMELDIDHDKRILNRMEMDDVDYVYADKYTVYSSICKILFPSSMYLLHHHKTGTFLSKKLRRIIADYCNITYSEHLQKSYDSFAGFLSFRENLSDQESIKISSVIMDFVRDPVLTIISGFKYHMDNERWASIPLTVEKLELAASIYGGVTDLPKLKQMYEELAWTFKFGIERPVYKLMMNQKQTAAHLAFWKDINAYQWRTWAGIKMVYLYYLNDVINQINLKNYGDYYGFDLNFDDEWIHKHFNIFRGNKVKKRNAFQRYWNYNVWYKQMFNYDETMKYGLYFEMRRYLFVVFPEIYDHHFNKISDRLNELKMEVWVEDFDQNANRILDALNCIDTKENRDKLKMNGQMNVDIDVERELLLNAMRRENVKLMVNNDVNNHIKRNDHIHIERNNTKYIHALLSIDIQICLLLKHITNVIEYGWQYHQYC